MTTPHPHHPSHHEPHEHEPAEDLAYIRSISPRLRTSIDSALADEFAEAVRVSSRQSQSHSQSVADKDHPHQGDRHGHPLERVASIGPPPDGGLRAWLVVIGSAFSIFCVLGLVTGAGQFQAYYLDHQLAGYQQSKVACVPTPHLRPALSQEE